VGQREIVLDFQLSRAPDMLSTSLGLPLPSAGIQFRRGIQKELELGFQLFTFGLGADLKYRFFQDGPWSLAVMPRVGALVLPAVAYNYGLFNIGVPLLVEYQRQGPWSLVAAPGLLGRESAALLWSNSFTSGIGNFELLAGGGLGAFYQKNRLMLSFTAELYTEPIRATGLYGGLGFSLGFLQAPASE
jgi:hypothetical protein